MRSEDEMLDLEMAFAVQHHESYICGDLYDLETLCRRKDDHQGLHASGYGSKRVRWA